MENNFLNELNEEQKQALLATEGAVLVTAGAGSGKTRLLTHRIYYLIKEKQIPQQNILAITFTNKASKEMKERVQNLIGGECKIWISTIHSMCATILRQYIHKLELPITNHFSIYASDDSQKAIRQVVERLKDKCDAEDFGKQLSFHISNMKNKDINLQNYQNEISYFSNAEAIIEGINYYQNILQSNNAMDFDDLLCYTKKLLTECEDVRDYFQNQFRYVLVDEFQDTNIVQYNIIKLLVGHYKNIFVVGDEDQCIYGWRGANIDNIKNFINEYEDCKVFKLEQNYRCTKKILSLANKLIEKNTERIPKTLYTQNQEGKAVIFRSFDSEKDEAEFVARTIYKLHNEGVEYKDISVLMRINALSHNFEEKFMLYNIPYIVYGGFKFYDRVEVKEMIAYLRFITNPNDSISFEKVINFPKRGIGETTINKIKSIMEFQAVSLQEILQNIDNYSEFNASTKLKISNFYKQIQECIEYSKQVKVSETLDFIYKNMGIKEFYKEKNEECINRNLNIQNLIATSQEMEETTIDFDIEKFLQTVTLVSDIDAGESQNNSVILATIHSVKGLEFDNVFIVGLEQKIFPIIRDEKFDEEERRLMYVALTRAKEQLYITNCKRRFMYGKTEDMIASVFLKDLGFVTEQTFDAYSNVIKVKKYGIRNYSEEYEDSLQDRTLDIKNYTAKKPLSELNASKFGGIKSQSKLSNKFNIGDKVNHANYGEGIIKQINGCGDNQMLIVEFDVVGTKTLLAQFAPLTKI